MLSELFLLPFLLLGLKLNIKAVDGMCSNYSAKRILTIFSLNGCFDDDDDDNSGIMHCARWSDVRVHTTHIFCVDANNSSHG